MNDYEAIRRLLAIYGQLLDSKRIAEWGRLFTEDAIFRVWGETYRGRAEIERGIGGMQPDRPGKHVVLQPVIDLDAPDPTYDPTHDPTHDPIQDQTPDRARVWTDLCALATGEDGAITVATIGRYHDRLTKDAATGHWRIAERVVVMAGEELPEGCDPSPFV